MILVCVGREGQFYIGRSEKLDEVMFAQVNEGSEGLCPVDCCERNQGRSG